MSSKERLLSTGSALSTLHRCREFNPPTASCARLMRFSKQLFLWPNAANQPLRSEIAVVSQYFTKQALAELRAVGIVERGAEKRLPP